MNNINIINTSQHIFDSFNGFVLSEDRKVFNKLIARTLLYDEIKNVPGDIVECGVFKGTGIYTFLKLKNVMNPNTIKKVIGFDFFDTEEMLGSIKNDYDNKKMSELFESRNFQHISTYKEKLQTQIKSHGFMDYEFELISGDVSISTKKYAMENPGFKISLLYMDVDLGDATYNTLTNLWDNVTNGGIIVFDEYGYGKWSESVGVDKFITERNIKLNNLNYMAPTAYIKK